MPEVDAPPRSPALRRRLLWSSLIVALVLKWAGASWDMSWHFRQQTDANSPAHITNITGNLLLVATLGLDLFLAGLAYAKSIGKNPWAVAFSPRVWDAFRFWLRRYGEQGPLLTVIAGVLIATIAIPLDLAWHEWRGIDLTTWSPTHLLLFGGTGVAMVGLLWLALVQSGWRPGMRVRDVPMGLGAWILVAFLMARVVMVVLFPAAFNEYAAVGAQNYLRGYDLYSVEPDIAAFIPTVDDLHYDDLPHALYPIYTLVVVIAFSILVRRVSGVPYLATALAAFYVATRILSDSVLAATGWPYAALPYQHILVALAVDACWLAPWPRRTRAVVGAVTATAMAYGYWGVARQWTFVVPLDWDTFVWAALASVLAAIVASKAQWSWLAQVRRRVKGTPAAA